MIVTVNIPQKTQLTVGGGHMSAQIMYYDFTVSRLRSLLATLCGLAIITIVVPANAATFTTYSTRTDFDAAVGPTVVEDLNSIAIGTSFSNVALDVGDFSLLRTNIGFAGSIETEPFGSAFYIDGSRLGFVTTVNDLHDMVFNFDAPIMAFGLDTRALNDPFNVDPFLLRTIVQADGMNVPTSTFDPTIVQFFGFISDTAFTEIRFNAESADSWSFDNIAYSSSIAPVPLPAAAWLMLTALGGMGLLGWRRKRMAAV